MEDNKESSGNRRWIYFGGNLILTETQKNGFSEQFPHIQILFLPLYYLNGPNYIVGGTCAIILDEIVIMRLKLNGIDTRISVLCLFVFPLWRSRDPHTLDSETGWRALVKY